MSIHSILQRMRGALVITLMGSACGSSFDGRGGIEIQAAIYADNCGTPIDVARAIAEVCDGETSCTCDKSCFAGDLPDPAFGCAKDLSVMFTYGGETNFAYCGAESWEGYVFEVFEDGTGHCFAGNGGGDGGNPGCTANSDCGSCERCELSTGDCVARLTC